MASAVSCRFSRRNWAVTITSCRPPSSCGASAARAVPPLDRCHDGERHLERFAARFPMQRRAHAIALDARFHVDPLNLLFETLQPACYLDSPTEETGMSMLVNLLFRCGSQRMKRLHLSWCFTALQRLLPAAWLPCRSTRRPGWCCHRRHRRCDAAAPTVRYEGRRVLTMIDGDGRMDRARRARRWRRSPAAHTSKCARRAARVDCAVVATRSTSSRG